MEVGLFPLYAFLAVVALLYFLIRNRYEFWRKRGIPYDEPKFLFGILRPFGKRTGLFEMFTDIYKKNKGRAPFAGFFMFTTPSVLLLDLDLVKNVLIKDFSLFHDRGIFYNEVGDPLTAHLFALDGPKWKALRGKLTPTFTSGKMRMMFPTMVSLGEELLKVLGGQVKVDADIDVRDMLARFATDVIGVCAFGIECNSLKDPNVEFRRMGNKAIGADQLRLVTLFTEAFPWLARFLHVKRVPHDIASFYRRIVKETVGYREKNGVRRNDFMDLLIDLKNNIPENDEKTSGNALTMNEIAAQSFAFFLAGFETASTTVSFALYALARDQKIQDKLRKEIDEVTARHNGEFTYEGLKEMVYLDQVIRETLRLYSPNSNLRRQAKADYPTGNPKFVIPKDAFVFVSIRDIQIDPEIFPNPEVFDPNRFSPEEIQKRHVMSLLAFGDGPRICIGLRFGMMQIRIGLAMLIKKFKFSVTKDTPIPMTYSKKTIMLTPEREIILRVEKIT